MGVEVEIGVGFGVVFVGEIDVLEIVGSGIVEIGVG